MLDEMYLQKCSEYSGGKYVGLGEKCNFLKSILVFMIVSLKKSIPYVIKSCPQTEINGDIVFLELKESSSVLKSAGFNVRSIVADNHSTNVSGYGQLIKCFGFGKSEEDRFIVYDEKKINLMYDSVHLLKNIRTNFLNSKRLIFPAFHFNGLNDPISVTAGEISWHLLNKVYKKDEKLSGNLRKAHKLTFQTLHPGNDKQSVPLALNVFDETTSASIKSYFPQDLSAAEFLQLINNWWLISNSKSKYSNNYWLCNCDGR